MIKTEVKEWVNGRFYKEITIDNSTVKTMSFKKKENAEQYGKHLIDVLSERTDTHETLDKNKTKVLPIHSVTHRFSTPEKMAEWLHNNYEEIALNNGWKTQEDCQVPFLELPKENKETMIELCDRFINGG